MAQFSAEIQALIDSALRSRLPRKALEALSELGTPESYQALYTLLPAMLGTYWYWHIVRHLYDGGEIDPLPLIQAALLNTLPDSRLNVRHKIGATNFLCRLPEDSALTFIDMLLQRSHAQGDLLRVIDVLRKLNVEYAHYLLAQFAQQPQYAIVRLEAIAAMCELRHPRFLNTMIVVLENRCEKGNVHYAALKTINAILPESLPPDYVTRLLHIFRVHLYAHNPYISKYIRRILHRLQDPAAQTLLAEWRAYEQQEEMGHDRIFR